MEKIDIVTMFIAFAFGLCLGMILMQGYAYQKGYEAGFDKALPLTYASVYKK